MKLHTVRYLYLSRNAFTSIPFVLLKMPNLQMVDLDGNKIEKVSKAFTRPKSLEKVFLCFNPLIDSAMYERMKTDSTVKLAWCDPKDNCNDCWKR
jgi:Leucine-rich repeat (LRR) protein